MTASGDYTARDQPLPEPDYDCPECGNDVWISGFDDATNVRGEGDYRDVHHCGVCELVVVRRTTSHTVTTQQ